MARHVLGPRLSFSEAQRASLRAKGEPSAPLWIVEYMDFGCPTCRDAADLLSRTLEAHPGKLYVQVRFHPFLNHRYALKSCIYAECAARQGRFWPFHDLLFEKQDEWGAVEKEAVDGLFSRYAESAGADAGRLARCVEDPETKRAVLEENDAANTLGVKVTPTFFVNGEIVAGLDALREKLREKGIAS